MVGRATLAAALAAATLAVLTGGSSASAQTGGCSTDGGYPEGSPGAVLAGLRNLSSGAYAACVEAQRRGQPARSSSADARRAAGRRAVIQHLTAPATAEFRNVRRLTVVEGVTTFCGEVSAVSPSGRRSAFVRFEAAVPDQGEPSARLDVETGLADQYFNAAWRRYCGPGGVEVSF